MPISPATALNIHIILFISLAEGHCFCHALNALISRPSNTSAWRSCWLSFSNLHSLFFFFLHKRSFLPSLLHLWASQWRLGKHWEITDILSTASFHLILVAWSGLLIMSTDLITSEKFLGVNTAYLQWSQKKTLWTPKWSTLLKQINQLQSPVSSRHGAAAYLQIGFSVEKDLISLSSHLMVTCAA